MEKLRQLSLRKSIFLYLLVALIFSFFASVAVIESAHREQLKIWAKYINQDKYIELSDQLIKQYGFELSISRPGSYSMSREDLRASENCDAIETWSPLILSVISSAFAVFLFYRDKLKQPLKILEESSDKIAKNSLDFEVVYHSGDEMGRLCSSFERMRRQLDENNRHLWKMIEEQKNLKAAIAHDIRAPLAVMKGYQEMLLEFIPQDRLDKQQLIEIIEAGYGQLERLTAFVDTMKQLSGLEEREIRYDLVNTGALKKKMEDTMMFLTAGRSLSYNIIADPSVPEEFLADEAVLLEVFENIAANAVRYAANRIIIIIEAARHMLQIMVTDDGAGFKEDSLELITKAYYHDNPGDNLSHFGLGLYISRILCERHGGVLLAANKADGGASVKAEFEMKKAEEGN